MYNNLLNYEIEHLERLVVSSPVCSPVFEIKLTN